MFVVRREADDDNVDDDDVMEQERELFGALNIPERTMINYLTLLEQHYRPNVAYHNSIHAADVAQTSHVMLLAPALEVCNDRSMFYHRCFLIKLISAIIIEQGSVQFSSVIFRVAEVINITTRTTTVSNVQLDDNIRI